LARISGWLLNVCYLAALAVCAPLIFWVAVRTGKYRDGYREKLLGLVPRRNGNEPCVWVHAVSVGEVNLMATLVSVLREKHPNWRVVVSSTSRTGFELARKKFHDLTVFYCPLDFSWAVSTAMRRVRPTLLVLAELELWPNLISVAKREGACVAVVNGRLSDKSYPRYRRIRPVVARVVRQLDLIATQNEETAARFRTLGAAVTRVHVTGSLKYDGAQTDRGNARTTSFRQLAGFADQDIVFLAGSTQEPEERIAIHIYRRLAGMHPRLRLVLVPRHPERFDAVARLLDDSGLEWVRRSELQAPSLPESVVDTQERETRYSRESTTRRKASIVLVDTIGELGAWWGTAHIAFVGGSFGSRGGQNMIEPAAYGAAVSFGPNTRNFRDIVAALLEANAAAVVHDESEWMAFVSRCLEEPTYATDLGTNAQALVRSQFGATQRTVALLESLLNTAEHFAAARSAA
jgi:3-deoxy-D-manno-octulosonic-acid transferase